jgi:two-component system cell cycle response regulator
MHQELQTKEKEVNKLLVVDDDEHMLKSYQRIFRDSEYEILYVSSGEEALKKAKEFKPDIVLLDIMMPLIDGYEVCQQLKNHDETKDIEVIFVSGKGKLDDRLRAYKLRASDFLAKPFSEDELLAKIELINERRSFYQELITTDDLTHLGNRKFFEEKFESIFKIAEQYSQVFTLAIIDIDFFKNVNDNYGHDVGDYILRKLAERLKNNLRTSDIIARIGGEEFAVILPVTDGPNARIVLERLRRGIEVNTFYCHLNNQNIKTTVSIGYASYPNDDKQKDGIFKRADDALYSAKHNGRNRVESYKNK